MRSGRFRSLRALGAAFALAIVGGFVGVAPASAVADEVTAHVVGQAVWLHQFTVEGTVEAAEPGGLTVQAWTGGACLEGWPITSGRVTTDSAGHFSLKIYPTCPTTTRLVVKAETGMATLSYEFDVPVARAAGRMTVSGWQGPYGDTIDARAHGEVWMWFDMQPGYGPGTLTVFRQDVGRARKKVFAATTSDGFVSGSPHLTVKRNTTFTVVYSGDEGNLPDTKTIEVRAHPTVEAYTRGDHTRGRHGWSLIHQWDTPVVGASVDDHRVQKLRVVAQRKTEDGWRTVLRRTRTVRAIDGSVEFQLVRHERGDRFRVRGVYRGDSELSRSVSTWQKFRFVR